MSGTCIDNIVVAGFVVTRSSTGKKSRFSSSFGVTGTSMSQDWQPLPPRGESSNRAMHRERRRRLFLSSQNTSTSSPDETDNVGTTSTSSGEKNDTNRRKQYSAKSSNNNNNNNPNNHKQPRRVNRPGYNTYLKVDLDDKTMDLLHMMALAVKTKIESTTNVSSSQQDGTKEDDVVGAVKDEEVRDNENNNINNNKNEKRTKRRSTRGDHDVIRFKPRSRNSLHMTLFFGGETVCSLPENELIEWHRRLSIILNKSGFHLNGMTSENKEESTNSITNDDDAFSFQLVGLTVFPPQRNNLVVGILEPAPEWHILHNDIRELAKDESCSKALADVTRYSKDKWVSHITLGNLVGGKRGQLKQLNPLLQETFFETLSDYSGTNIDDDDDDRFLSASTKGISLGGPIPTQEQLDWDFRFIGSQILEDAKED